MTIADTMMTKRCSKCKLIKELLEFTKDKSRKDGRCHRCKACGLLNTQAIAARQKKTLGKVEYRRRRRKYELTHYYGISPCDYDRMVERQKDKCAICGTKPEAYLAIDHCHNTNQVRGLLCRKCNSAVGLFDDDIQKIERVLVYLKSNGTEIFFRHNKHDKPIKTQL